MDMSSIVCYRCMWNRFHREATYSSSPEPGNLGSPLDVSIISMKWAASGNGNRLESLVGFLTVEDSHRIILGTRVRVIVDQTVN